jgi:hypothetical protein
LSNPCRASWILISGQRKSLALRLRHGQPPAGQGVFFLGTESTHAVVKGPRDWIGESSLFLSPLHVRFSNIQIQIRDREDLPNYESMIARGRAVHLSTLSALRRTRVGGGRKFRIPEFGKRLSDGPNIAEWPSVLWIYLYKRPG